MHMGSTKLADVKSKSDSTVSAELKKLARPTSSIGILLITATTILILRSLIRSTKKPKTKNQ